MTTTPAPRKKPNQRLLLAAALLQAVAGVGNVVLGRFYLGALFVLAAGINVYQLRQARRGPWPPTEDDSARELVLVVRLMIVVGVASLAYGVWLPGAADEDGFERAAAWTVGVLSLAGAVAVPRMERWRRARASQTGP